MLQLHYGHMTGRALITSRKYSTGDANVKSVGSISSSSSVPAGSCCLVKQDTTALKTTSCSSRDKWAWSSIHSLLH